MLQQLFATCPKAIEPLLANELNQLGAANIKLTQGGVHCTGDMRLAYRICLWSRLANRLLLLLHTGPAETSEQLYCTVQQVPWMKHLLPEQTFMVDFTGLSRGIVNTHFGSLKVKDAVVDYFNQHGVGRPLVDRHSPHVRINAFLHRGQARISLDLAGDSLHRRGYRIDGGLTPLKENLAAAILIRSGWPDMAVTRQPLIDPMCGSGTLLIEAALMAADVAPGLLRQRFALQNWCQFNSQLWHELYQQAEQRSTLGKAALKIEFHGYDAMPKAVSIARQNIHAAGMHRFIRVSQRELKDWQPLTHHADIGTGLIVTNPPYGARTSEVAQMRYLYQYLGKQVARSFSGWRLALFTGNPQLGKAVGLRSNKQYRFYNGSIISQLLLFELDQYNRFHETIQPQKVADSVEPPLDQGGQMFANRLKKNVKKLARWQRQGNISSYRLYDADMPEYAVAIDRYGDYIQVQEYAAPSSVDHTQAAARLSQVMSAVSQVLHVPPQHIFLKQRRPQKGHSQYSKLATLEQMIKVEEGGCRLLVNLVDYLDTGLFLDHRLVRLQIQHLAAGKTFLNLFCYSATATMHAIQGGARRSLSVDMSPKYISWGQQNLALNGFGEGLHRFEQADCLQFIKQHASSYDLILLDPPTFSNSKKMQGSLDIQRDHPWLIRQVMRCLNSGGLLIFSNHFRRFSMADSIKAEFDVKDITAETLDVDFKRNPNIHNCWEIRHHRL